MSRREPHPRTLPDVVQRCQKLWPQHATAEQVAMMEISIMSATMLHRELREQTIEYLSRLQTWRFRMCATRLRWRYPNGAAPYGFICAGTSSDEMPEVSIIERKEYTVHGLLLFCRSFVVMEDLWERPLKLNYEKNCTLVKPSDTWRNQFGVPVERLSSSQAATLAAFYYKLPLPLE